MSAFDAEVFENTVIEQEMETKYTPLRESKEAGVGPYTAFVDKHEFREVNDSPVLRVVWKVTDEKAKQQMDREDVYVNQDIFLDGHIGQDQNGNPKLVLEFGPNKNVKLGKLRAALGQNDAKPWSFSRLDGAGPAMLDIVHRPDKNDSTILYNDVARVSPVQ